MFIKESYLYDLRFAPNFYEINPWSPFQKLAELLTFYGQLLRGFFWCKSPA